MSNAEIILLLRAIDIAELAIGIFTDLGKTQEELLQLREFFKDKTKAEKYEWLKAEGDRLAELGKEVLARE